MKKDVRPCLRILFSAGVLLILLLFMPDISVEALINYTPSSPVKAALFLFLLYGLKSLTVFFPLIVLELAAGLLLPIWQAMLVNFGGMVIILTIPYWIGHRNGLTAVEKLIKRYPKFQKIIAVQQDNAAFLSFFFRVIRCLPGDIVTMYLGASDVGYHHNLLGGILGLLPGMILSTLIGQSIRDPASPMFWFSISLSVLLSVTSILLYRNKIKKERTE